MAPRIAEEIWEQYRDEIIALYCAPKPEGTLKKTMQTMKEKHGFQATKSQYTTKFEAWGLQKYADSTIWAYADQKTRKRKLEEDKDTGLIIHGRKRTPQEIEREIARNVTHTSRLQLLQDIPTPEGVQAFTPGAAVSSTSVAFREVCTSNLPSVQLHKMIHQLMCKNPQVYKFDSFSTIDNLDISVQSNSQLNSSNSPPSAAESQQRPLRDIVDSAMSSILRDSLSKRRMSLASYFPPDGIDNDWMLLSNQLEGFDTQFALPNLLQYFIGLTNNGVIIGSQLQKGVEWILTNLSESFLSDLFSLETTAIRTFMRKILPAVVTCGNTKVVECIIEKSIDILSMANHRKRDGYTQQEECMSIAITNGDSRMVELLCTAGFSPQIVSQFFPPHPKTLWDTENLGALHILLSLGADPECFISNQPRGYPLMDAAKSGNLEAVKMLVKKGSRVNPIWQAYIGSPLQAAVWAGHLEIAEFLIGCGANINAPFGTQYQMLPANDWAECRNCYAGECLCQIHMSMYWSMKTPIEIACARNNVSLAGLLVTHGANVDLCSIQQIEEFLMFCSPRDGPYSIYSPHRNKIHFLSALQHSVHNGNITLVRLLLTNGANPDARGILDWGDTPLQLSIRLGYTEIAQILIAHGANVNASPGPYNGRTAIQAAAESGNIQLAQMLLKKGARINAPPGHERGLTALQAAIKMGHPLMAGFLCLSGADIDAYPATEQGITAIQAAAEIGDLNLINDLVRQGAYMDNTAAGNRAIVASILHKNLPMVKLFVKHGAPINGQGKDDDMLPIVTSVMIGWIDGVRYLLDNGADINSYQYEDKENDNISPLAWSIINHDIDMIKLLLKRGASLRCPFAKSPYNDSLCLALYKRCSMKIIDKLINEYIKEDPFSLDAEVLATAVCNEYEDHGRTRTETILNAMSKLPETSYVAQVRNAWNKLSECRGYLFGSKNMSAKLAEQVIKLLLQAGADINNRHPWMRCTLLQTAVERKNTGIAKVLIEEGADIQGLTSNSIGTPLQIAIRYNETDFAHFLLERGADINAPPAENSIGTALQAAVSNGNKPLVSKLLERGAEVNAPSAGCYGLTALHEAANGGYIGIAIDLLRHGALVAAPALTKYGKTAIDAAAGHGHEDMLQLLLNHYDGCEDLSVVCERAAIYAEKEGHCEIASWLRQYPSLSTDGE